jgi:hypothetical protein
LLEELLVALVTFAHWKLVPVVLKVADTLASLQVALE